MRTSRLVLTLALCGAAACGKKSSSNPDAPPATPDASTTPDGAPGACDEVMHPEGTISAFPGNFAGATVGHGANLDVAMGICTVEDGGLYFDPVGDDVVVKLTGLTVGTTYGVTLDTTEDLSFYVITGCTDTAKGPSTGQCQLFEDQTTGKEQGSFMAAATEEYIVVDSANDPAAPTTGAFTLSVVVAQCTADSGCTATPATPACEGFQCTQCHNSFGCAAAAMEVCSADHTCVAGSAQCTGDDAHDNGTGDDGPSAATSIAVPTAGKPTVATAAICDTPTSESDWYTFTLTGTTDLGFALDFTGATNNIALGLFDSTGTLVNSGTNPAGQTQAFEQTAMAAGTYYLEVLQFAPAGTTAAVPYTLTVNIPACAADPDCTTGAKPVCGGNGLCAASPGQCTGDDVGDTTSGGDNGPAGARALTPTVGNPATLSGQVCNQPATERDLYKVTVANGAGLTGTLTWTGSDDLDLRILDAAGTPYGVSFWKQPEVVTLSYLPAGTYYLEVTKYDSTGATSPTTTPYTISAAVTAPQTCGSPTDCATEHATQIYRGQCTAGSCHFITTTGGASGTACDSNGDCSSGSCSYLPFESNAQKSVCTTTCTMTSDCAAVHAGFTCTTSASGGSTLCVPSCAADLDCGADTTSGTLTTGQPWAYNACTTATGVCALP